MIQPDMIQQPAGSNELLTFSVLGLPMHLTDNYVGWLVDCVAQSQGCHVVTLNAEMTMQAEQDPKLAAVIRQAELVIPDGSGIVFYLRLYGKRVQRRPGIEVAEGLLHALGTSVAPSSGSPTVLFYGGKPGVADQAAAQWRQQVPTLAIATQHGYLPPDQQPAFQQFLKDTQPAVILVGLGVPRQEFWIAEHRPLCPHAIWIGVGGSFDIWSGSKDRAPEFFRNNHLEWLYRLYQEPWRWRRMLALPQFALKAIAHRVFERRKEEG